MEGWAEGDKRELALIREEGATDLDLALGLTAQRTQRVYGVTSTRGGRGRRRIDVEMDANNVGRVEGLRACPIWKHHAPTRRRGWASVTT